MVKYKFHSNDGPRQPPLGVVIPTYPIHPLILLTRWLLFWVRRPANEVPHLDEPSCRAIVSQSSRAHDPQMALPCQHPLQRMSLTAWVVSALPPPDNATPGLDTESSASG